MGRCWEIRLWCVLCVNVVEKADGESGTEIVPLRVIGRLGRVGRRGAIQRLGWVRARRGRTMGNVP